MDFKNKRPYRQGEAFVLGGVLYEAQCDLALVQAPYGLPPMTVIIPDDYDDHPVGYSVFQALDRGLLTARMEVVS